MNTIKHKVSLLILLIPTLSISWAQVSVKFPQNVLSNPIEFSQWFDSNIELKELPVYQTKNNEFIVSLENGYAAYELKNKIPQNVKNCNLQPQIVEIVFTKYPLKKEDWITNYYELLANRLKELFTADSNLNSQSIEWRLVLQTNGLTEPEAKKLFHGIVITFGKNDLVEIPKGKPEPLLVENKVSTPEFPKITDSVVVDREKVDPVDDLGILYPQSIRKKEIKTFIPEKVKNPDEPDCPKFPTRMENKRRKRFLQL